MLIQTRLALLVCLGLAACGSHDPLDLISAGEKQLIKHDYAGAVSSFETALEELGQNEHALRKAALLGRCEALAAQDAPFASRAFLSLAESEALDLANYRSFTQALRDSQSYEEAAAILKHGQERFPDEPLLEKLVQEIGRLAEAADSGDDNSAMKALEGLGYVSSGAPGEDATEQE